MYVLKAETTYEEPQSHITSKIQPYSTDLFWNSLGCHSKVCSSEQLVFRFLKKLLKDRYRKELSHRKRKDEKQTKNK